MTLPCLVLISICTSVCVASFNIAAEIIRNGKYICQIIETNANNLKPTFTFNRQSQKYNIIEAHHHHDQRRLRKHNVCVCLNNSY